LNRRRFLNCAAGTAAAIVSSAIGFDFLLPTELSGGKNSNSKTNTIQASTLSTTRSATQVEAPAVNLYLNRNGDFASQIEYWHPWHGVSEIGYPNGLPTTQWSYCIRPGECGVISIDNPNSQLYDHAALSQWSSDFPPYRQWSLSQNALNLEAEVMLVEQDVLYGGDSWNRAAIAFQWSRRDFTDYTIDDIKHRFIYSELDFYRNRSTYFHEKGGDVYEYHAHQVEAGQFKKISIDLNDFFRDGFDNRGGWGDELCENSRLSAWYLVVETRGGRIDSAWRNVRIFH
jgi:hypothetical protein